MKRGHQTDKQRNRHRNSMKESDKGRFFENLTVHFDSQFLAAFIIVFTWKRKNAYKWVQVYPKPNNGTF